MRAIAKTIAKKSVVVTRVGWAVALLATFAVGCGFSETAAPSTGGAPGTSGSNAVIAGTSGASTVSGGSGGAPNPTSPLGGSAGLGQGGELAQAGTATAGSSSSGGTGAGGASGGSAGSFSVAGGPPAFSAKPLSVVAYSPYRDGQAPGGQQPTMEQVRADLVLLKPLVDGVRVYGTDGANAFVPALCDELGIDLHIGAWIDGLASDEPNTLALATVVNANHPSIKTAIVGNEVLARSTKNGMTEEKLLALITTFKAALTNQTVTVAAADTYPQWMIGRPNLAASVDLLIWHTYGWWSGVDISNAYNVVSTRYDDMLAKYPGKKMLLGETGWPSMYDRPSTDLTTTAVGSAENQAKFYREALAGFRARNLPMWMFSAIDEQWKATSGEGAVGAYWGIFNTQRQPKAAALELMSGLP